MELFECTTSVNISRSRNNSLTTIRNILQKSVFYMLLFFPFTLKIFFLKISPRLLETNDVSVLFYPVSQLITGQCIYERDRFHFKKKKDLRLLNSSRFNKNCNFTRQIRTRKFKLQTSFVSFPRYISSFFC